jgi:hypothetical protein
MGKNPFIFLPAALLMLLSTPSWARPIEPAKATIVLSLKIGRLKYDPSEDLLVQARLTNSSSHALFVRRAVGWGESSSVSVWIQDLSGSYAAADFLPDLIDESVSALSQLEELKPGVGKNFSLRIPLAKYNLKPNKKYKLTFVYHSSISELSHVSVPLLVSGHPRVSAAIFFLY